MPRPYDLSGRQFGYWTVESYHGSSLEGYGAVWVCRCICGIRRALTARYLLRGTTRSCGCKTQELRATTRAMHTDMYGLIEVTDVHV